ncbi:MAG: acylneuraminate cytidylyltransferase [Anaerolinea sp.]|nr:acylneuraminate cytidylyltransferase [Anaerolinea sp.]
MPSKKIVALVPMRHHSQRVPGKNYRLIAGKPLYAHIIETLLLVPEVSAILVDTDSDVILDGLAKDYPDVICHRRPEALRADDISMNEILIHDTVQVEADLYLQTHSTNPLLKAETISRGILALLEHYPAYDSLFGVTRRQVRYYDELGRPINHNPAILMQTQDLPPVFEENSCLYLFTRQILEARRNRLGERPMMFEIDPQEAWDVDNEVDFSIAEMMIKARLEVQKKGN